MTLFPIRHRKKKKKKKKKRKKPKKNNPQAIRPSLDAVGSCAFFFFFFTRPFLPCSRGHFLPIERLTMFSTSLSHAQCNSQHPGTPILEILPRQL
jgi:hypothetical protein